MTSSGFILKEIYPWPDDWIWFEKCFNIEANNIEYFTIPGESPRIDSWDSVWGR